MHHAHSCTALITRTFWLTGLYLTWNLYTIHSFGIVDVGASSGVNVTILQTMINHSIHYENKNVSFELLTSRGEKWLFNYHALRAMPNAYGSIINFVLQSTSICSATTITVESMLIVCFFFFVFASHLFLIWITCITVFCFVSDFLDR